MIASFQHEGTMNGDLCESCFERTLLKNLPKKRVIIMDNTAFHKKEVLQNLAGKLLANRDLFVAVFAGIQSH